MLVVFLWSLSDSKSPQISRTLLSILADFNNDVSRMVSIFSLISNFYSPFSNLLGTVQVRQLWLVLPSPSHSTAFSALWWVRQLQLVSPSLSCPIIFFIPLAWSRYQSLFSHYFSFIVWSAGTAKSIIRLVLLFSGLVVWNRLNDLFLFQNSREINVFHFSGRILGCAYTLCSSDQI